MTLSAQLQDLCNQENTVSFLPKVQLLNLQHCTGLEWSACLPGLGPKLHGECWASTQALGELPSVQETKQQPPSSCPALFSTCKHTSLVFKCSYHFTAQSWYVRLAHSPDEPQQKATLVQVLVHTVLPGHCL